MFPSQLGQVSLPSNSASDRVVGELPRERLNWLLGKTEGPSLLADHQWAEEHTQPIDTHATLDERDSTGRRHAAPLVACSR